METYQVITLPTLEDLENQRKELELSGKMTEEFELYYFDCSFYIRKNMIISRDNIYIGKHRANQTIEGFIAAFEEVTEKHGTSFIDKTWIQDWRTSDDGGGHYESKEEKGFNLHSSSFMAYVYRAFKGVELNHPFESSYNQIPSGGYYNATGFIRALKRHHNLV